ncbi:MAG: hypothetical protein AB8H03_15150 [Saprospiraceae bacterium]
MGQQETSEATPIEKPFLFYGIVIVLVIGIILLARYLSPDQALKRKLKKINKVAIRDFKNGPSLKIGGKVLPIKNPLFAPLSSQKCVGYHLIIEKENDDKTGMIIYDRVIDEVIFNDFFISDLTGLAEIKPQGAAFLIQKETKQIRTITSEIDERIKTLLEERGLASSDDTESYNLFKVKEGIIEVGEEITVSGQGHWKETEDPDYLNKYPKTLVFSHTDQNPLLISDDPKIF